MAIINGSSNDGSAGIDWGMFGGSNRAIIDGKTYHYGVIPASDGLQAWVDSSEMVYPEWDNSYYGADDVCDKCGKTYAKHQKVKRHEFVCESAIESFNESAEVREFVLEGDGYAASQGGDDPDIFIVNSPYFTYSALCSPCAPGAGYLLDDREFGDGIRTFCFAHDFFDDHIAPYGVWRVDTGALVLPDNPHVSMLRYTDREDFEQWVKAWRDFNNAIFGYAEQWGTRQESNAARVYVNTLESAFDAGGYAAVVACGAFEKMVWCE